VRWAAPALFTAALLSVLVGCDGDEPPRVVPADTGRTIVLGFDGMDPKFAEKWMDEGALPNFSRLAAQGYFGPLGTSIPAQSPVSWSSFATGLNPGEHGIYDFLRRDPQTYFPDFSVSETILPNKFLEAFGLRIPLADAQIRNRRAGTPFWSALESEGGGATVMRVPVTFPPDDIDYMVSGMGVPDLLGTQGTYTLYSTRPAPEVQSGRVMYMRADAHGKIETILAGPPHPLEADPQPLETPLIFSPADDGRIAVILGDSEFTLGLGEWSDWVTVSFDLYGLIKIRGLVRLHLLDTYPRPRVYVSPIQIDPRQPVVPIASPAGYASQLAERIGLYHTIGMPEETWSLNNGDLTDEGFLDMIRKTFAEREAMLLDALENNDSNLVIGVFVQTDRVSHMFYRGIDPEHKLYEQTGPEGREAIAWAYREADRILGKVMDKMSPRDRLIVISDHGFSPYRWSVHLNRWLVDNGYMKLTGDNNESDVGFAGVDWSRTRAYAVGLNSIYINLQGREALGSVAPVEVAALKKEIADELLTFRDPDRDQRVVKVVYDAADVYDGNANDDAPDLVVGYQPGYRASWQTTLGAVPGPDIEFNMGKWSGDHCVAADEVPGVLFTSFELERPVKSIQDVASYILDTWKGDGAAP
jgi:predicted AlkP superfamily phosphohydrolase/phosphomutase